MTKFYYAFLAVFGAVTFLMVFGGVSGAEASQLYVTCGDAPGFCPNPPVVHCNETGNINICEE